MVRITLYALDVFKLLDVTGTNESLRFKAAFGIVKLIAAIGCALFLVDVIGRKRALVIGVSLQAIAMIYVCRIPSRNSEAKKSMQSV